MIMIVILAEIPYEHPRKLYRSGYPPINNGNDVGRDIIIV